MQCIRGKWLGIIKLHQTCPRLLANTLCILSRKNGKKKQNKKNEMEKMYSETAWKLCSLKLSSNQVLDDCLTLDKWTSRCNLINATKRWPNIPLIGEFTISPSFSIDCLTKDTGDTGQKRTDLRIINQQIDQNFLAVGQQFLFSFSIL